MPALSTERPPRTLGLSLAIILSVVLFTLLPMLPVVWIILFRVRLTEACASMGFTDSALCGAELLGVDEPTFALLAIFGVLFLFIAIFAWYGRPKGIRFVMMGAVCFLTAFVLLLTLLPLVSPSAVTEGASTSINQILCFIWLPFILIPAYIVWYLNRAPARAFYRGYYLPEPETAQQDTAQ